ncbi:DegT/DnrJ/EryC1/StrS family aminotransferase [Lachnospiraceae bacterium KGMB03038]|nr:DegT/DnrJ/EryC1/StrS family aminotransferase [Lachnospiraceae bacterium KGMB03038]
MKFRDLGAQYNRLKEEIDKSIQKVLSDGNFIGGTQIAELEEQLAEYVGVKHCITCANGTDALTMVLMAWNIQRGDAVFVPDFTFFASGEVVAFEGATPVFYDVCQDTFNANVSSLEKCINNVIKQGELRPRAIIAVDLFGQPANYPELEKVAEKYNLLLLEDGAQGFGGRIGERRACSFGDAATTSFFPAKPLGCYGDGGAIFTNDDKMNEYLRSIKVHGKGNYKYDNVRIGWNSRLDTIQAAVLQVKLKAFREYELEAVNRAAERYTQLLGDIVNTPKVPNDYYSSWAQYTLRLESNQQRESLQQYLKERAVPTMVYYPKPMHCQKAFEENENYIECPITENLCSTVLSLPMHPYLTEEEIAIVAGEIRNFI